MKELQAAIIGCGMISKNHLKALNNIDHVRCSAVCDIIPEQAETAAAQYGISKIYTEYQQMLKEPELDVVHICTPHHLHTQMAVDALLAGKHVICEKPMALSEKDADQMTATRNRTGKNLGICFQNRYNEAAVYMKKQLSSKKLGNIIGARGQVIWDRKPEYYTNSAWRGRWDTEGGGVLINQAIHTFDLLRWLTGPVKTVEASISTKRLRKVIEVEDTVDILMTGADGQRILFYASNCYVKNSPVELEIICEKGSIKMIGNEVVTEENGEIIRKDYSSGTVLGKDYWGSGHGLLISDFYQCIQMGKPFPISAEEGIISVQLLEAVYRSAKEGIAIEL